MILVSILVTASYFSACECKVGNFGNEVGTMRDPDTFRNPSELISTKGYPVENHTVETADGYILSLHRIPHGRNSNNQGGKKQVVYLQHGFEGSAADWLLNFPEQSLGFILADAGYDVWLGNSRGNAYSRRHVKYSTNEYKFWNFSYDQMAQYDIPAVIDYVLNATDEEKLYYIGHSQGAEMCFALLSENPEFNKKIKLFVALAPPTAEGHMKGALRLLVPFRNAITVLSKTLGLNELLPRKSIFSYLLVKACEAENKVFCESLIFSIAGSDRKQLNESRLGVYVSQLPAGSSVKSLVHHLQAVNSNKFAKYDYGINNQEYYNQPTPPEYDVSRITTPVAIAWSLNDKLVDPADIEILRGKLKSLVSSYLVPFPEFNHLDFVMAIDARKLLYEHVLSLLVRY